MSVDAALLRIQAIQSRMASLSVAAPTATAAATTGGTFAADLDRTLSAAPAAAGPAAGAPATGGDGSLGAASPYDAEIAAAASEAGVPPALLKAMCRAESGFDPSAVSRAGAQGLMQLMPSTAAGLGVTNPFDPTQSLRGGARYLRGLLDRFGGDERLAVAAYNAGSGAVQRYGGVPPYTETQAYVARVLGYEQEYGGAAASVRDVTAMAPSTSAATVQAALRSLSSLPTAQLAALLAPAATGPAGAAPSDPSSALSDPSAVVQEAQ